jgi:hypothetical protein
MARNGAIYGQRSFVKQVQRPDVQRSSGQVDSRRRSRFDSHFDLFPSSHSSSAVLAFRRALPGENVPA